MVLPFPWLKNIVINCLWSGIVQSELCCGYGARLHFCRNFLPPHTHLSEFYYLYWCFNISLSQLPETGESFFFDTTIFFVFAATGLLASFATFDVEGYRFVLQLGWDFAFATK